MTEEEAIPVSLIVGEILAERTRQLGKDPARARAGEDAQRNFEHAKAAASLTLVVATGGAAGEYLYPWATLLPQRYAPTPRGNLLRAAALLLAEIERLDRAEARRASETVVRAAENWTARP